MRQLSIIYFLALLGAITSCRGTFFLTDDQKLYTGSTIKYTDKENLVSDKKVNKNLEELLRPEPNTTLLGMRPLLWIYGIARNTKKDKGIKHWLKTKMGEEPVLMEDVEPSDARNLINKQLLNEGYFLNDVSYQVLRRKKTASVHYEIDLNPVYRLRNIQYPSDDDTLSTLIDQSLSESLLKEGHRYELGRITNERERIERFLKNRGFYYFDDNFLRFEADSTVGEHQIDLFLTHRENLPSKALQPYNINNIHVVPSLNTDAVDTSRADTLQYEGVNFIRQSNNYKPGPIVELINFRPGDRYTYRDHDRSINKLVGLGTFRYVNVNYSESDRPDHLDITYRLAPYKKKSIRLELQAISKSTGFVGPAFTTTFQNRNFFKGGELFQLSFDAGFETQISGKEGEALNSYEFGLESSLTLPKFLSPFKVENTSSRYVPKTIIKVGARNLKRVQFFTLQSLNLGYGYSWNETITKKHEVFPIDVNLVSLANTTLRFDTLLDDNPLLRESYEEQFTLGSRYSYFFNTQGDKSRTSDSDFYFNGNINLSGNLAYLLQQHVGNSTLGGDSSFEVLGEVYAQYVKGDTDFRFYHEIDQNNRLATRLIVGVGYPYGNSETLPYVRQFSIGGTSSIRAFRARSVGPGSFRPESDEAALIDKTADVKLELNVEYRFNIISAVKGATFVDAGNIWLLSENETFENQIRANEANGNPYFEFDSFLKEIAVGSGFGLRYDAEYFVIRLDAAFPMRDPADGWFKTPFRGRNIVYNIAIGYPF